MAERVYGYEYLNSLGQFRFAMTTKYKLFRKQLFRKKLILTRIHYYVCFYGFLCFYYVSKVFFYAWTSKLNREFSENLQCFNCISWLLLLLLLLMWLSSILYKRELDENNYCFTLSYRNVDPWVIIIIIIRCLIVQ